MKEVTCGKWRKLVVYALISLIIYGVIRCLGAILFPFLAAILLVRLFYPVTGYLKRKLKISPGVSSLILFIIIIGILGIVLWSFLNKLIGQAGNILNHMPQYEGMLDQTMDKCCGCLERVLGLRTEYVRPYLLDYFYKMYQKLVESFSQGIMTYSYQYAKGLIRFLAVLVVIAVVLVLLSKDYDKIRSQLQKSDFYGNLCQIKKKVFHAAFIYIRAQLIIMALVALACIVVFFFMGVDNALLLGTGIGFLDALPFIGTGSILVPWAIYQLTKGKIACAAILVSLYLVCSFGREFLEPKLIGKKLGVLPVYIMGAMYAGIVLYGVAGVILGPLQALLTVELGRQWIAEHGENPIHT